MKTTGWLVLSVFCFGLLPAGDLEAGSGPRKLTKSRQNYTAKPYKFKKWKAPKAGKVQKWTH